MSVPQPAVRPQPSQPGEFWVNAFFFATIAGVALSIGFVLMPAAAGALVALAIVKTTRVKWWWIALGSLALAAVLSVLGDNPFEVVEEVMRKAHRVAQRKGFDVALRRIWNHKWQWWTAALPTVPLGCAVGAVAATLMDSRYPLFDPRAEVQKHKAIEVSRERAIRKVSRSPESIKGLAVLGPYAHGDLPPPWVWGYRGSPFLCFHPKLLGRHAVVVGKPGSGKTTTLLKLAYLAAKVYGWRV